jgi:hypothetical protein
MALTSILLQYGGSPSILGHNDETPFDVLRETGQRECLDVLMEAFGKHSKGFLRLFSII